MNFYNKVYTNLKKDVEGLISAGYSQKDAIEKSFSSSCAGKSIKDKIIASIKG